MTKIRYISNYEKSNLYREKIHNIIPGGAHTYSKGDDQFPLNSPAAIAYGKGSHIWDIDNNEFIDCSMGLTSVVLGHAYEPVLKSIRDELDKGVNFQRPSYIEMELAERFLSLIPCHDMIKFGKNGSLIVTAAVKLARAYTNRKLVAFPYDHPFYSYDDWFIGKTLCNRGIPEEIQSLSVTYKSDDLNSLKKLFDEYPNQIACIVSEPEKQTPLPENYLKEAIELCHNNGALYILDEMITGFKTDFPGSIKKYNVEPDMATWGKSIANGFSLCALTGKKDIMELGGIRNIGQEKVFLISTTHGGETHSIRACLATIEEFINNDVLNHNLKIGSLLIKKIKNLINDMNLNDYINITDTNWLVSFSFRDKNKEICQGMRTLIIQEMIKRGVLFQGIFVPCFSHNELDIEYFTEAFEQSLHIYTKALDSSYIKYLIGNPAKPVFRKYL
jgi:glutamate-1-semialdehyde 2,1-aminomutase